MPYKYIGRTTDFKGKSLWEIVGNLKNLGIGRIVARNRWERYPEPSFCKIVKVETLPNPKTPSHDELRKVKVWVEKTFRGRTLPNPVLIESASYKTDYKLIPKDEESEYCKTNNLIKSAEKILPRTMDFPPLLKESLLTEIRKKGTAEKLELEIVYQKGRENNYKIAKDGEKPNVEVVCGLGTPVAPRLYEGIKL